tara:strand:- start:295 stop:579 length:285 start_codon:yes stop_codon:yes gene_type:complete
MKMTIVIDTSDPSGLLDAQKIANLLCQKYARANSHSGKSMLSKLDLIKLVREYGKECHKLLEQAEEMQEEPKFSGLRFAKDFIDDRMASFTKCP